VTGTLTQRMIRLGGILAIAWLVVAFRPAADASPSPVPIQPKIALSVSSGVPGTVVTINGTGYPPLEIVAIYLDIEPPYLPDRDPNLKPPGPVADGQGSFHETFVYPGPTYDATGHVKPTTLGLHAVCGDTAYPGSTQRIPSRSCAQFEVLAQPSPSGATVPELLGAFAVLVALAVGMFVWMRRSQ
jgi:hypothetical protein